MEPENENWSQPYEGQTEPSTPSTPQEPERKSFFQQEGLQRTVLNVKLATWLKCIIVIAALAVTAALVAPKFTPAQSQQQETSQFYSEFQEDWYEDCEESWYDEGQEEWYDDSEEEWYDDSEDWYDYDDCYDDYYEY